jgi:hypothetical protein
MGTKLSELTESTVLASTDILHTRTSGGVDKKITGSNFVATLDTLLLENYGIYRMFKGLNAVNLTNFLNNTQPQIDGNSAIEIDGGVYWNTSNVSITGSTSNSTWYDIQLTPSGTSFTAAFVARGSGIFNNNKQGLYNGTPRVVACVYRDSSGNFNQKNILNVQNRTVEITLAIGSWNMQSTSNLAIVHGLGTPQDKIISCVIGIYKDSTGQYFPEYYEDGVDGNPGLVWNINSSNVSMAVNTGKIFDSSSFSSTSINRGYIFLRYRI